MVIFNSHVKLPEGNTLQSLKYISGKNILPKLDSMGCSLRGLRYQTNAQGLKYAPYCREMLQPG